MYFNVVFDLAEFALNVPFVFSLGQSYNKQAFHLFQQYESTSCLN